MKHGLLVSLLALLLGLWSTPPVHAGTSPQEASEVDRPVTAFTLEDEDEAPYTLSAAYPNPFRARTQFKLQVKETQQVSIEVYNILGQRVRTLFKGPMRADDPRIFTFAARGLPSGLYLYRITGETFSAARRVTLVR